MVGTANRFIAAIPSAWLRRNVLHPAREEPSSAPELAATEVSSAYADRHGRKKTLLLTISLMTSGTAIMAIVPTYGSIGAWAAVIVIAARMLQAFSVSGEYGAAVAFLVEQDERRRGFQLALFQPVDDGCAGDGLCDGAECDADAWTARVLGLAHPVLFRPLDRACRSLRGKPAARNGPIYGYAAQ